MKFFDKLRNNAAKSRISEEMIYEQVSEELNSGIRREGLWAKALSESNGSDDVAKSIYIKLRYQSIVDEVTVTGITDYVLNEEIKQSSVQNIHAKKASNVGGVTSKTLICLNCNREGRMLIKVVPLDISEKVLIGIISLVMSLLLVVFLNDAELVGLIFIPIFGISYFLIYIRFFKKQCVECPSCGNRNK